MAIINEKTKGLIKKYWWIALALLIVIIFLWQRHKINKLSDQVQVSNVELSTLKDSVEAVTSKNGDLTFKLNSVQVESDNRRDALEKAGFEIKEFKNKEVKWRDVVSALKAQIESSGSGTTVLRDTVFSNSTDTIRQANFDWTNKYLTLSGNILNKQMDFRYNYRTHIQLITEQKGKSYIVSASLGDPNASLTTGNSITINPKKKWIGWRILEDAAVFAAGFFLAK